MLESLERFPIKWKRGAEPSKSRFRVKTVKTQIGEQTVQDVAALGLLRRVLPELE
jgi:hypothetical protein